MPVLGQILTLCPVAAARPEGPPLPFRVTAEFQLLVSSAVLNPGHCSLATPARHWFPWDRPPLLASPLSSLSPRPRW